VEYKLIYRSHSHTELLARSNYIRDIEEKEVREARIETQSADEARDWSNNLNALAEKGFEVRNSGALQMTDNIVFWALLEKP
jgi:hypothetical protein